MLPTLLIIGAPAKLVLWGERMGIECPMSQGGSLARDSQTRQVAAIFRTLHHQDEGFFVKTKTEEQYTHSLLFLIEK